MNKCGVCGGSFESHYNLHHEYTETDQLIPKKTSLPAAAEIAPATTLGRILLAKGLITPEEFNYAFPGIRPDRRPPANPGDLSTGSES